MTKTTNGGDITATTAKTMLTVNEASKFLGMSKAYLYKLTSQRKIKHYKPGGKTLYFKAEDLLEYMTSNPIATMAEIEDRAERMLGKGA
ncbi:MAG: helix-turn-helix domain-containing protein [Bacteroidales bacterium]|nr:helix-turn-helix domain-containing protein [Bacteroidales bacterium]